MKSRLFKVCLIALTYFVLNISAFGQSNSRDSLIVKKYDAIKIKDSINSSVPSNIRMIAIEFLSKSGLDPKEYYTLGIFQPRIIEIYVKKGHYDSVGSLNLVRINALREVDKFADLSDSIIRIGASGGKDDDIILIYDIVYTKVIEMIANE